MNEDGFYHWLKSQKFTIILSILCACIPFIIPSIEVDSNFSFISKITNNGYLFNICNIIFILITLFSLTRSNFLINKEADKSSRLFKYVKDKLGGNSHMYHYGEQVIFHRMDLSFKQFYYSWIVIWVIWLIMYIGQLIHKLSENQFDNYVFYNECLFENTLNLVNSFALFVIYMVITIYTVNTFSIKENRNQMHTAIICLIFIGVVLIFFDFHSPNIANGKLIEYYKIQFIIRLLIGIIASISLMAVLGRLNSSFLDIPQWLIISLYFYAAIQMLYPLTLLESMTDSSSKFTDISISNKELINKYITVLTKALYVCAFFSKILLFILIKWIMLKKRFLFFLIHKAHTLAESDNMLIDFNEYYESSEEKNVNL